MKKNGKKSFLTEFKEFIMRGNVLDMAIGVIIATSFGKITSSLVNDIFMPLLSGIIGDIDLTNLNWVMIPAVKDAAGQITSEAVVIGFGTFLSIVIDFILVAFMVFLIIKFFNKTKEIAEQKLLKKKEEVEEAVEEVKAPTTEELLTDILAELKKQNIE